MKRGRIVDCFDFITGCFRTTCSLGFEEFEPPQGECHCETVEDLIDLEDHYEKHTDGMRHQ